MHKVLLTVVHYLLFVPIASVVRLFRDPLDRAWDAERTSYWIFTSGDVRPAPAGARPLGERAAVGAGDR